MLVVYMCVSVWCYVLYANYCVEELGLNVRRLSVAIKNAFTFELTATTGNSPYRQEIRCPTLQRNIQCKFQNLINLQHSSNYPIQVYKWRNQCSLYIMSSLFYSIWEMGCGATIQCHRQGHMRYEMLLILVHSVNHD